MNIYKTRARLKLDQVRADIADLPDDANTAAMRGFADLIELMLAEPGRQIDAHESDPNTGLAVAPAKLSRAGVSTYPKTSPREKRAERFDAHNKRVQATIERLTQNGHEIARYTDGSFRASLGCGGGLTFWVNGKVTRQGKHSTTECVEIAALLRADGWVVK